MGRNPQQTADLATFTEEILNRKLHFLCSEWTVLRMLINLLKAAIRKKFHRTCLTALFRLGFVKCFIHLK